MGKKLAYDVKGDPLAIVRGGRKNNEIVYFVEDNKDSSLKVENLLDHVSEKDIKKKKKYMSLKEVMKIKRAFEENIIPDDILNIYNELKDEVKDSVNKHIHIEDGIFDPIPLLKDCQVDHCFYAGMNGVGKSTQIANYCNQYLLLFPKNKIYLFSRSDDDEAFKGIPMKTIELNDEVLDSELELDDFCNSLCIFDDIDTLPKDISKKIQRIRDDMLECGRKKEIYMCNVSHQILNYKLTRTLILESNKIIFFPRSSQYQVKRFLQEYLGIEKSIIKKILNLNSRWVMVNKTYPLTIISEHDIYII